MNTESDFGHMTSQGNASPKHARSNKLDRTLKELESAFTDWESLNEQEGDGSAQITAKEEIVPNKTTVDEKEFRKKTRMLLSQLREQLAELND